ncbi:MAG: S8 family serine peptidase [Anaerolineales bacterium]|jgi:subtilisin|nr:S8 family serine peptidase [Anaerolineales bacterium]
MSTPIEEQDLPAWSDPFMAKAIRSVPLHGPLAGITRTWAWGNSTGKGIKVAVIDSGIEHDHPALEGAVRGGIAIEYDPTAEARIRFTPEDFPQDIYGHGTACAAIIHALAPEAELYSVRVLGRDGKGRSLQFAAGIDWAVENGMHVMNMSLSSSSEEYFGLFHQLADDAYFKGVVLVSAVNNIPAPSYPSLYSSVISVAAHDQQDPFTYYYNPAPPVEFGAPGIDVKVAWTNKSYMTSTGNSFAAPHIAGIVTLIRAKHPELTPFQIKAVLHACANNIQPTMTS